MPAGAGRGGGACCRGRCGPDAGVPNVGKSALINRLGARKVDGQRPPAGVTPHPGAGRVGQESIVLDAPACCRQRRMISAPPLLPLRRKSAGGL